MRAILFAVICSGLAGSLMFPGGGAAAQAGARASLGAPDASDFPGLSFYLDVYDARGAFMDGLETGDVHVLENGAAVPVESLELRPTGLQIILAYNTGPAMATRVGGSASVFEVVQKQLVNWAGSRSQSASAVDDFTLITNDGLQTIRQADPQRWAEEISGYQPDLNGSKPGMGSLSQALDIATDPNPQVSMKRALLYVTAPPAEENLVAFANIAERARQVGLRVFVWVVTTKGKESSPGIDALYDLALQTGGQAIVTTDAGNLPNLESFLRPLRQVYWVRYTSQINRGGVQALQVVIAEAGSERDILSNEQQFRVDIQPPNPMFLTPPGVIERSYTSNKRDAVAEPLLQELRIMVDFPDGHPRDLRSVALLVDGVEVTRLVSAPFDVLTWDLSDYDASAEHALQLEVEDELGLRQTSLEFPVEVVVESPRGAFSLQNIDPQRLMIAGAIALAALALGAVLWIGGRRGVLSRVRSQRRALQDPVTQPVVIQQEQARLRPASQEHPSWPRPAALPKSPAWLAPLADESQADTAGAKIPIQRREMTIGSSPRQATCVINLPSVDQLHARIYQPREGEFYLADAGSVAGTWVNYNPAPPSGIRLKHGDLISIGQVTFRFELARPGRVAKARVSEYKEEE